MKFYRKNKNNDKRNNLKRLYSKNHDEKIRDIQVADTYFSRLLGLMFKKSTDYPLLFKIPKNRNNRHGSSIHSCFMRFELKLVFIDENNIVFELADLKPWRYYVPKKGAKYIIEIDKNKFNNYNINIGDEIVLE